VPAGSFEDPAEQIIDVKFRRDEIRALAVTSDQHVRVRSEQFSLIADPSTMLALDVPAGEDKLWRREEASSNPFRQPVVTKLYAKNLGNAKANVRLTAVRRIATPECTTCRSPYAPARSSGWQGWPDADGANWPKPSSA
jgi:hypothetical protein